MAPRVRVMPAVSQFHRACGAEVRSGQTRIARSILLSRSSSPAGRPRVRRYIQSCRRTVEMAEPADIPAMIAPQAVATAILAPVRDYNTVACDRERRADNTTSCSISPACSRIQSSSVASSFFSVAMSDTATSQSTAWWGEVQSGSYSDWSFAAWQSRTKKSSILAVGLFRNARPRYICAHPNADKLFTRSLLRTSVSQKRSSDELFNGPPQSNILPFLSGTTAAVCQSFLAVRAASVRSLLARFFFRPVRDLILLLSHDVLLCDILLQFMHKRAQRYVFLGGAGLLTLAGLAGSLLFSVTGFELSKTGASFADYHVCQAQVEGVQRRKETELTPRRIHRIWLWTSAVDDLLISLALAYTLHRRIAHFNEVTDSLLKRLIISSLQTAACELLLRAVANWFLPHTHACSSFADTSVVSLVGTSESRAKDMTVPVTVSDLLVADVLQAP